MADTVAAADGAQGSVGILAKSASLLRHFVENGTDATVREVSVALSMPRSTVHRLCQQLVAEGFLRYKTDTETYSWGPLLLSVSRVIGRSVDTDQLIDDVLDQLMNETNETALLTTYDRGRACIIITKQVESRQKVLYKAEMDTPWAVHAGATGKSILAYLPEDELRHVVDQGLEKLTDETVTDAARLADDLERIRQAGVAVSHGERTEGAVGHACPVFDFRGDVVGSLCVTVPAYRHSAELEELIRSRLRVHAREVSEILGWAGGQEFPPTPRTSLTEPAATLR